MHLTVYRLLMVTLMQLCHYLQQEIAEEMASTCIKCPSGCLQLTFNSAHFIESIQILKGA